MTKLLGTSLAILCIGLTGCSTMSCGDSHPYLGSVANSSLHAPTGLSVPAPDPSYAIPGVASRQNKTTSKDASGTCLVNPPQLIKAQPTIPTKPSALPKSGPVVPAPGNTQPALKSGDQKVAPPTTSATEPPPVVAAAGRME